MDHIPISQLHTFVNQAIRGEESFTAPQLPRPRVLTRTTPPPFSDRDAKT